MENKIRAMFTNLCCSRCKADFDENSIKVIREEDSMLVVKLFCNKCGKAFGTAFLGVSDLVDISEKEKTKVALRMKEDLPPISKDDVLNAHDFIKNLDEHWAQYLPEKD